MLFRSVYLHCHHGKHRSAGAAATVAASLGWLTPTAAVARMKVSGTAPAYPGLYACASSAVLLDAAEIDRAASTFPERVQPTGIVETMVAIDDAMERLKMAKASGWNAPADHPDLAPAADAGTIVDHVRTGVPRTQDAGFAGWIDRCHAAAQRLEDALGQSPAPDGVAADGAFRELSASCTGCHAAHRDRRRAAANSGNR